jgi:hypothetical protein
VAAGPPAPLAGGVSSVLLCSDKITDRAHVAVLGWIKPVPVPGCQVTTTITADHPSTARHPQQWATITCGALTHGHCCQCLRLPVVVTIVAPTDWTSVVTAVGTILVAVAAVGIAIFSERRTDSRVAAERARSDRILGEERVLADKQIADERATSKARLQAEHERSDRQLREERQRAQDAEQLAEAYAVQVVHAEKLTGDAIEVVYEEPDPDVRSLVAIVVNHGRYTITGVEARFHLHSNSGGGSLVPPHRTELVSGWPRLNERLRADLAGPPEYNPYVNRLAPWDTGIRFESDRMAANFLLGAYPVLRWIDQWGTQWEHKLGEVRQVDQSTPWSP